MQTGAFIRLSNLYIIIFLLTHFYRKTYYTPELFTQSLLYTKIFSYRDFYTYSHTNHFQTRIFLGKKNNTKIFLHTNNYFFHMDTFSQADGVPFLVELSLPPKSASWLIINFLLVKKLAMKLEILSCKATVCFWTQMCFCKTSSPVVGFPHAIWAVFKNVCHSFALLVAIGFPSSWNMIIPSQCWVTQPPNESSTGDDQSHSVFRVVGDPALWLIPIVGNHWSNGSKLIKNLSKPQLGGFLNTLKI